MARRKRPFIVLEGPDKSGKSTQAALLTRYLKKKRIPFIHTREPGGTSFAEAIRRVLLNPKHTVDPLAELFLYEAARAQHTKEKLVPALRAGRLVLCERYTLATLVYQGFGRRLPLALIRKLNDIATGGLKPDLTFVLDIPVNEFSNRGRRRRHDRLENEPARFRRRVRKGYHQLAREGKDTVILDGRRPAAEIHRAIVARLREVMG